MTYAILYLYPSPVMYGCHSRDFRYAKTQQAVGGTWSASFWRCHGACPQPVPSSPAALHPASRMVEGCDDAVPLLSVIILRFMESSVFREDFAALVLQHDGCLTLPPCLCSTIECKFYSLYPLTIDPPHTHPSTHPPPVVVLADECCTRASSLIAS